MQRTTLERRRRGESNIRFPLPALDVTTLIIDLGKQQLRLFCIFLEYERLIYFFNQGDRCQHSSGKKKKKKERFRKLLRVVRC